MNFFSKGTIVLVVGYLFFNISFLLFEPSDDSPTAARTLIPHANFEQHAIKSSYCLGCSPCGLFGRWFDKRERVIDSSVFPYSIHACLRAQFEKGRSRASCTLISPHSFVTTAHSVLNDKELASALIFQFELQTRKTAGCIWRKTETFPGTTIRVPNPQISIHPDYLEKGIKSPYDIAVITLDETATVKRQGRRFAYGSEPFETGEGYYGVGEHYGYAGIGSYEPQSLIGSPIHITGYPARVRGSGWTFNPYTMAGIIEHYEGSLLFHKIDSSPGQSGAAPWRPTPEGGAEIIGIHLGEGNKKFKRLNKAVALDGNVRGFLSGHLERYDHEWWESSGFRSVCASEVRPQGEPISSEVSPVTIAALLEDEQSLLREAS